MSEQKHHYSSEPEHYILSSESEPLLERLIFNNRSLVIIVLMALTALFGYGLSKVTLDASIEKYIPLNHEYIQNYLVHKDEMKSGVANVKIAVETTDKRQLRLSRKARYSGYTPLIYTRLTLNQRPISLKS